MSFSTGTATSYTDLLDKLNTFLATNGTAFGPLFTGIGNGPISAWSGGSESVAETVTVTFTSATAFNVVGSVSGAIGSGTAGTPFTSTKINFTVTSGGTAFIAGDAFTLSTAPKWTAQRSVAGSEYIWTAPGNDGVSSIFVGAKAYSNISADYYNWKMGGFNGYTSGNPFETQPGSIINNTALNGPSLTLWNSSTPYWFIANGRRVVIVAQISTVWVVGYLGLISTYPSPGTYPYPLLVSGNLAFYSEPVATSTNWRWSYVGAEITIPFMELNGSYSTLGTNECTGRLRLPSGGWAGLNNSAYTSAGPGVIACWPWVPTTQFQDVRPNLDGSYPLLPIMLTDAAPNIYGEPDGVMATTGHANAAGNTFTVNFENWLVVQNISRTTKRDYIAVRLG